MEDYSSNYVERDERRLADLGRRAVEIFAVSHILRELESVHSMEESIKRQDALIKEVGFLIMTACPGAIHATPGLLACLLIMSNFMRHRDAWVFSFGLTVVLQNVQD